MSKFASPYVLRCNDGKLYVGSTTDLKRRMKEHEGGLVPAISYRLPAKLVYYGASIAVEALKREVQLKTGFGRGSTAAAEALITIGATATSSDDGCEPIPAYQARA